MVWKVFKHKEHAEPISRSAELRALCRAHLEEGSWRRVGDSSATASQNASPHLQGSRKEKIFHFFLLSLQNCPIEMFSS